MSAGKPIEGKVPAAAGGAGIGAVLAQFIVWFLDAQVFEHGVPNVVEGAVWTLVPIVLAYAGGWLAKHTNVDSAAGKVPPLLVTVAGSGVDVAEVEAAVRRVIDPDGNTWS